VIAVLAAFAAPQPQRRSPARGDAVGNRRRWRTDVLSANESHIFEMNYRLVHAMRRTKLRRENLPSLLAEVRAWLATFDCLEQLQAQVSEAKLVVGRVRTVNEFAKSDWVRERNAVVQVDDRGGGTYGCWQPLDLQQLAAVSKCATACPQCSDRYKGFRYGPC
jgi:crotonobetainyl-CoA:carnitine CoA-transferase CaiB-like acyl-CoA transferase